VARASLLHTNFTAGELSPRLYGRVDVARYQNGAKQLRNANVLVQGGVIRSYGSRYIAGTKNNAVRSRLIPFVFNRTQAYALEFGDQYMRVFRADGTRVETSPGVAYEIATPYTEAMLPALDYCQGADTMFLFHEQVPVQRLQRFLDTLWTMEAAPWVNPPVDEIGERFNQIATLSAATVGAGRTLTVGAGIFSAADNGRTISAGAGLATITAVGSATSLTVTITRDFASTSLAANTWTLGGSPLTTLAPDVSGPVGGGVTLTAGVAAFSTARNVTPGGYIRINGGLIRLTTIPSATSAQGVIVSALSGTTQAQSDAWSLEFSVWNSLDGYPRSGTLWEQRLIAAGSTRFPQTVWGTRSAEYLNFQRGVNDDDGFAFTIATDEVNPIQYITGGRTLIALTGGGEFTLQGGVEKPITPTNVQIRPRSNHGCAQVRPAKVGREQVFVQVNKRKLRAFSYNASNDDYTAPDITVLSEHITLTGIRELAWQKTPEPWLWALREDGSLACCTYELQDENVVAWTLRTNAGSDRIDSICVLPDGAGGENLWTITRRVVNGATVRYVERFQSDYLSDGGLRQDLSVVIPGIGVVGGSVAGGYAHLVGRQVDVVGDGSYLGRFTVDGSGLVTFGTASRIVEIGLPYTTTVELLTPELQMQDGTAQGNSMRIGEITLRFLGTVGGRINGQQIPTRTLDTNTLDAAPESTVGLERIENLGWDRGEAACVIEQDVPLPFYLLSVVRKVTANS
jgi:hypothetical protein